MSWLIEKIGEFLRDKLLDMGFEWLSSQAWIVATIAGLSYAVVAIRDIPVVFAIPLALVVFNSIAFLILKILPLARERWFPGYISLLDAATTARDALDGHAYEAMAEASVGPQHTIVHVYANAICQYSQIEAKKVGARVWRQIDIHEMKNLYVMGDDCDALGEIYDTSPRYTQPRLRRSDMRAAIRKLQEFSL